MSRARKLLEMSPQRIKPIPNNVIQSHREKIEELIKRWKASDRLVSVKKVGDIVFEIRCNSESILCYVDSLDQINYFSWINKIDQRKGLPAKSVYQSLVWKNKLTTSSMSASDTILEILLPKFGSVCSDSQQSSDGERLWDYIVRESLKRNHRVRIVNFYSGDFIEVKNSKHYADLKNDSESQFYGEDSWFQKFRICIYK